MTNALGNVKFVGFFKKDLHGFISQLDGSPDKIVAFNNLGIKKHLINRS